MAVFETERIDNSIYFALCDQINEAVLIMETDTRKFIYCNRSYLNLFGIESLNDVNLHSIRSFRKKQLNTEEIGFREKVLEENGTIEELVEYVTFKGEAFFGEVKSKIFKNQGKEYYLITINPLDKAIFEHASLGILLINQDSEIININPFITKQFGYTRTEIIGKKIELLIPTIFDLKYNETAHDFTDINYESIFGDGLELQAFRSDGSVFPVEVSLSFYPTKGNKFLIAFVNDISRRKIAESELIKLNSDLETIVDKQTRDIKATLGELQRSNDILENVQIFQKAIIDSAGVIIIATDEKGVIKFINSEASKKLGYTPDELINKHTPVLFHETAQIETMRKELQARHGILLEDDMQVLVESARRMNYSVDEYNMIRKDWASFPVILTTTSLKDKNQVVTGFLGVALDISRRKKAELELKNVQDLFLQLLRNYPDGSISIIDNTYHFIYTGGELHKKLDGDAQQLIGKKIYPKFPESLRKVIKAELKNVFTEKAVISDYELPIPIEDNVYVMDAFPLLENDGTVNKAGVITRNISALKKIEDDLRESLKKEKELSELKSRFVTMASHEFRTPLSTVLSSAYLIQKYSSSDEQIKREKHIDRIVSSVNMLTDILNDFLNVGKIEEGRIQVRATLFDVKKLVQHTCNEMEGTLKKLQTINYQHSGEHEVLLDETLLKHIIMNLVSNAGKFSQEDSRIEIKTVNENNELLLSVKDQGIGISKEDQKHLMERFFRGSNALNIQGTGLGLHIVSKYAELMDATITFNSEIGHGTEFLVTFNLKNG